VKWKKGLLILNLVIEKEDDQDIDWPMDIKEDVSMVDLTLMEENSSRFQALDLTDVDHLLHIKSSFPIEALRVGFVSFKKVMDLEIKERKKVLDLWTQMAGRVDIYVPVSDQREKYRYSLTTMLANRALVTTTSATFLTLIRHRD
jgi:hypothetical protein